jgi:uncharacterized membrane protein YeiB
MNNNFVLEIELYSIEDFFVKSLKSVDAELKTVFKLQESGKFIGMLCVLFGWIGLVYSCYNFLYG